MGDDARLAGSGAGQNQQRPVLVEDGCTLFGVEVLEQIHPMVAWEPGLVCRAAVRRHEAGRACYSTVTLFARLRG